MSHLLEFQRALATDILYGGVVSTKYVRAGRVPPDVGIRVHRNTVVGALANAIRLSCPTLGALVDASFFEQSVRDYARARPPSSACLWSFGEGFARFLESYPPAGGFPFFADVVRFDTAIDETGRDLQGVYCPSISIGMGVSCRLLASLRHISTQYPVDTIRDKVEAGQLEELEHLDITPRVYDFALWPSKSGASVKRLTAPAAAFLKSLLGGHDVESAMNHALGGNDLSEVLSAVGAQILTPPLAIVSFDRPPGVAP
jgi:hypothetical protein